MHTHQGMPGSAQGGTEHSANFTGADNADAEDVRVSDDFVVTPLSILGTENRRVFQRSPGASTIMADRYRELCRRRCVIGPGAVSAGDDFGGNAFGIVRL